ncbi:DeoR/GlpR family DNA-binding transcription regulator [Desulfosporosinus sp. FKA]|uniref:DeoR/GlpR family DNA-binding transcription regulator n=1 Tax=Desulfosporosinus sp. FKA TaxID=1969834 RepID=UPI000B496E8E|nr:DeoR/GlpR family DNA-binding transcription regulator [Desulfosporosinus sp. FKA]
MFQIERRDLIMQYLERHESATVEELAKHLNVTPMTIRRDLNHLEDTNIITRTFGGAVLKSRLAAEVPYKHKSISHKKEKERIAEYAVFLVQDGQIVFLDSGTTTMEIVKRLTIKKDLTVVTNDVMIAAYLANHSDFKILCTGGYVQNRTGTCMGSKSTEFLQGINGDICFVGANAIDLEKGVCTPTLEKADVKRQMLKSAATRVLVVDSSKFNKRSFSKVCDLDDLDIIVTDINLDEETVTKIKDFNLEIRQV